MAGHAVATSDRLRANALGLPSSDMHLVAALAEAVVGPDIFGLIRRWQQWLEVTGRANDSTRKQYRRYLLGFMADTLADPLELTEDELVEWADGTNRRGEMYGMTLRALRSFYRFAIDRNLIRKDPSARMRIPKHRRRPPPRSPDEQIEALFAAAERIDPRARPTLELMFATGARIGSLCAVIASDIDLAEGRIVFRVAKGDEPYDVPLGSRGRRAAEELLALIEWKPRTAASRRPTLVGVGPGRVWDWVSLAGEASGVKFWPHRLRHEFAHRIANDTRISPFVASALLNHKDPRQLRIYADPDEEQKRLAVEV